MTERMRGARHRMP